MDNSSTKEFIQAMIDDDSIRNSERPINQVFIKSKSKTFKDGSKELVFTNEHFCDMALVSNQSRSNLSIFAGIKANLIVAIELIILRENP